MKIVTTDKQMIKNKCTREGKKCIFLALILVSAIMLSACSNSKNIAIVERYMKEFNYDHIKVSIGVNATLEDGRKIIGFICERNGRTALAFYDVEDDVLLDIDLENQDEELGDDIYSDNAYDLILGLVLIQAMKDNDPSYTNKDFDGEGIKMWSESFISELNSKYS